MVLVIDNYDSFTFNLVQLIGQTTRDLLVIRNDERSVDEIAKLNPDGIMISPGPGRPENAGVTCDVIRQLGPSTPMIGVCLGHQAIGQVYGGRVVHADRLMHGKTSEVTHDGDPLFDGVDSPFTATRYHSLVLDPERIPDDLQITARTKDGTIMGLRHKRHPVEGIQFHPESILTDVGPRMIRNWLASLGIRKGVAESQ